MNAQAEPPADLGREREIRALAALLAELVDLTRAPAVWPGRYEDLAELALEYPSVCAAMAAEDDS